MKLQDWFAPGLEGHAVAGLDAVIRQEEHKLAFVRTLRLALANPIPHAPDRIALLHEEIKTLDKTLRLRVGMLPLDRPQAWFRATAPSEKSPFATAELSDPVFMPFEESQAAQVRLALPEYWRHKKLASDRYEPGFSLWGRLLTLNKKLYQLNQLPAPFHDISLDELPDAVPDVLASPALASYGAQIAQRMTVCRRELDACYAFLWSRSESFLYALHVQYMAKRSKGQTKGEEPKSSHQKSYSHSHSHAAPPPSPKRKLSPLEEALQFMNFSRLPSVDDLRSRYRAMAQTLHPDRGGCEERFKDLSLHYQALLKQLQRF